MFIEERHRAILGIIAENGSITTGEIQNRFGISYDSAKRDLRILEEKGLLKRTHGGAIPVGELAIGRPKIRQAAQPEYDQALCNIARRAVSMIAKDELILIASDKFGRCMAREIKLAYEKNSDRLQNARELGELTVVTNQVGVAAELVGCRHVKLTMLGGEVDERGACCDGFAVSQLSRMRFDKAFITTDGISKEFGLSVERMSEMPFWDAVIRASRSIIGIYSSEAVGADSRVAVCDTERLSALISDAEDSLGIKVN